VLMPLLVIWGAAVVFIGLLYVFASWEEADADDDFIQNHFNFEDDEEITLVACAYCGQPCTAAAHAGPDNILRHLMLAHPDTEDGETLNHYRRGDAA